MDLRRWERLREGVVGEFQPLTGSETKAAPGMIKLNDDHAQVTFIAGDEHLDRRGLPHDCAAVFGDTEVGDILMTSISQLSGKWGGFPRAHYRSRCLVLDPPASDIDGDTAVAVQLHYYGLSGWSGERRLNDDPVVEDGKIVSWTAELTWHTGTTVPIDDQFSLRFGSGHSVTGAYDRRTLTTPLIVSVESQNRRPIGEHLARLDAIHALFAIAHRETPLASGGDVRFTDSQKGACELWERTMISLAPLGDLVHEFPHLELDQIGGTEGVASWVRLCLEHRRAVDPLVKHVLFENQTPEARLLSTAAAMEYWVRSNARKAPWAKRRRDEQLPGALARYVDAAWATWIGDSDQWVSDFWNAYNDLKHFRGAPPDPMEIHALEVSGRWLLTAALLDHCTGTSQPSSHLFSSGLRVLGGNVRDALWGPEAGEPGGATAE